MKCIKVLIATAEQEVYRGTASILIAPSVSGEIAIMARHAPLLAVLRPGEIRITCPVSNEMICDECHTDYMVVFGGYIEVQPDAITILADAIERAADIDEAKAKKAAEHARKQINSPDKDKASRAFLELELAIAKLRVAHRNSTTSFR